MSKVFIEESSLTAIGNAVRAKTGSSDLLVVPDGMVSAISSIETGGGGGDYFTDDDLTFTNANCAYMFEGDKWTTILEKEKGRIKINNPKNLDYFLHNCTGEDYSFITITGTDNMANCSLSYFAYNARNLKKLPTIKNLYVNGNQCSSMLGYCVELTEDEIIKFYDNIRISNNVMQSGSLFSNLYTIRNMNRVFPYLKKAFAEYTKYFNYSNMFSNCYSLDEIKGILIFENNDATTSNRMGNIFNSCNHVKDIEFEKNEDGTAKIAKWKSQTIDLTLYVGYSSGDLAQLISGYNSCSITAADKAPTTNINEFNSFIESNPNWWTDKLAYSRYNHDSAVNTINSLPDTSAYLASAGGTNTIKFKGESGSATNGGAINTLTEEEIAVATAKGWTVTFV